ncbi:helix-turn-helix domain-containing protein [Salinicoccus albus]|uniref:helix-turn-helix domain-containing protein n=1 Tax=Salinicoccus albus TaxID=418756 RepID=UPI000382A0EA|nr:helix-turn-helix transcriptional regulator [Salinicoccus albus]
MTLGERIKNLRKSQKLTLATLAGDEITKGMLSLIENDKSKPSMETLQYLAKRLDVSIGYLTQEGDEEWTKEVLNHQEFDVSFTFPYEYIEQEILPYADKIAQNNDGMYLYGAIRVYYRLQEEHEKADEFSEKIDTFYKSMGFEHLALRNRLDDAISLMFSRDYGDAYNRIIAFEDRIEKLKVYDPLIELDYLFYKGLFAFSADEKKQIDILNQAVELSFELEQFKYFNNINLILGMYHLFKGELEDYEVYQDNLRKYFAFNTEKKYLIDVMDLENPIPGFYILVEDPERHLSLYKSYMERVYKFTEEYPERFAAVKYYTSMFELEIQYFEGEYQAVIDNYHDDMYIRPIVPHPIDRIIMAVRSCIYPLSLHYLGKTDEAKEAFNTIEETIEDIKDSIFTKEFYMIRDIIFAE